MYYPKFIKKTLNLYSEKEKMIQRAMTLLKYGGIEGDYLEFGVWEGNSFSIACKTAKEYGLKGMRFYAFDSFEGLPETNGNDNCSVFKKGDFRCDEDRFKTNLKRQNIDLDKVITVKGWYSDILNYQLKSKLEIHRASLIMVDCDLYSSAKYVMDFITDYIQDGTVIMFDDYFCYGGSPFMGERKAFEDWLKENPDIIATEFYKFHTLGDSFVLHKR